jgi:cytochrome P450
MRLPGNAPRVMLARHEEIRAVFTGDGAGLGAGAANALVAPLVGPPSVLILDGPAHQRQRHLLLALFNGRNAARQGESMRGLTEAMVESWPVGVALDLAQALQTLTLRIIVVMIFGVQDPSRVEALAGLLTTLLDHTKSPLLLVPALQRDLGPLTPWRRSQRLNADLDAALGPLIEARREAPGDDLLSQLVTAVDEAGQPLSAGQIRDDLVTASASGSPLRSM